MKKFFSFSSGVEASDHVKFFINGEIAQVDTSTIISQLKNALTDSQGASSYEES